MPKKIKDILNQTEEQKKKLLTLNFEDSGCALCHERQKTIEDLKKKLGENKQKVKKELTEEQKQELEKKNNVRKENRLKKETEFKNTFEENKKLKNELLNRFGVQY